MDLQDIPLFQISPLIRWLVVVLFFYFFFYTRDVNKFTIHIYHDSEAPTRYECWNRYYVCATPWQENKLFGFLLWKCDSYEYQLKYYYGLRFYDYRQMQVTIICRELAFVFLFIDTILCFCNSYFIGAGFFIWIMLCRLIVEPVPNHLLMKHDIKRLKSYQYRVAIDTEPIVTDARRKPPTLWKINTLLDVFFYFGQAPIRFSKTQNYLIYRLKNGKLLYVFLKDSFETMPEEDLSPYDHYGPDFPITHYNPAMTVWVDECICVDSTNPSVLSGRDIHPQDMPEVILSNHS